MTKYRKNSYRSSTIVVAILFCLFLLPNLAHGQVIDFLVGNTVLALLAGTLAFIRGAIVGLIGLVGSVIDSVLKFGVADSPVVQESWEIVRNFANMLFIIALIVMAFGTIFNIRGYDAKTLIARFIIAALLINFSLVIGNVMIGWTQSLSNVFLSAIGDVGARIAEGVSIADLFKQSLTQVYTVDNRLWTETITVFINIILLSIVLFSLLVLLVLTIIRIPILWALLIVSPVAWMTYILPSTNNISKKWWKEFIGWNLFLPIYLFFIYFGVFFLANQQRVISGIANQSGGLGTTFQQLFFFVLVAIFLIGGAKVARGMSSAAGAGGVAAGIWARGRATARFAGSAPFKYGWRASGAEAVYKEASDKFKKEGFAGFEATEKNLGRFYRGERGRDETAAWLGQKTGLAPGLAEKQLSRNIDIEKNKLRERHTGEAELRTEIATATDPARRIAAAQRLQEEYGGALDASEISKVLNGVNLDSEVGAKIFKQLKLGDVSSSELRKLITPTDPNNISNDNARSLIYNALIERGGANKDEFKAALTLARGGAQKAAIIRKGKEFIAKSLTSNERKDLLGTFTDQETQKELVKIMAGEGDTFFHDARGNPNNADLARFTALFENAAERKKVLEDVAKKDAHSAAMVMLDDPTIRLRDDTGAEITRASHGANAEKQILRQVLRKLSVEDKLTQHQAQYPHLQGAIAEDMSRNTATFEKYLNDDKYLSAQPRIINAQRQARQAIYTREYLQPFNVESRRMRDFLRDLATTPPAPAAIPQIKTQAQSMVTELKNLRRDYEKLCRKNDLLAPSNPDAPRIQTELRRMEQVISGYNNKIATLN
ncbi:MAG: hypothetical protein Q7S43_04065 [bacterium]|nr:hypothetical protein [bacterium]